jgi:hypothetical protein
MLGASKIWKRNSGGRGRGRGRGGSQGVGRGRPSSDSGRIDFIAIANALTPKERKKHIEDGLCFKCHKKGHRLFQCPEVKGKAAMGAPSNKQLWWQGCCANELEQPPTSTVRFEKLLAIEVVDTRSTSPSTTVATPTTVVGVRRH